MSETIIDILENYCKVKGYYPLNYNFINSKDKTISVNITDIITENIVNENDIKDFDFESIAYFDFPYNNTEQQLKDTIIKKVTDSAKKEKAVLDILIDPSSIKIEFDIEEGHPIIWIELSMKYVLKKDESENKDLIKDYKESMKKDDSIYDISKESIALDILSLYNLTKKLQGKIETMSPEYSGKIKDIFLSYSKSLNEEHYNHIVSSIKEF